MAEATINFEDYFPSGEVTFDPSTGRKVAYTTLNFQNNVTFGGKAPGSPASFTVATQASGYLADYYTDGTNDNVEIQAAINAAAALTNGGTVLIKAGTYTLGATITPKSKVRIIGEGIGTIIAPSGNTAFAAFTNIASVGSPTTDYEISNLKIDGTNVIPAVYSTSGKGIFTQYSKRARFDSLYVYNTSATGIGTDFLVDSIITNCIVESCGRQWTLGQLGGAGIGIGTGGYTEETVLVSNCLAKNNGQYGIFFEQQNDTTVSRYMQCDNSVAYGNYHNFGARSVARVAFTNCYGYGATKNGLFIDQSYACTVKFPQEITATACIFTSNGLSGIKVNESNAAEVKFAFNANLIAQNVDAGIQFQAAGAATMTGNLVYLNGADGIRLDQLTADILNITIGSNTIFNNGTVGTAGHNDGIKFAGGSSGNISDIIIAGNRIYDDQGGKTQRYAIAFGSGGSTLSNIIVKDNDLRGNNTGTIFLSAVPTSTIIRDNLGVPAMSTKSASYTLTLLDSFILMDSTSAIRTATLPTAVGNDGVQFTIKDWKGTAATNNITVATTSAQTIDGAASIVMATNKEAVTVVSDGANWSVISEVSTSIL